MADTAGARRLAAVLAAGIDGYARNKTRDPMGAVDRARSFAALCDTAVRSANGISRNVQEGLTVAEFASAVDAVGCARALLQRVAERNLTAPRHDRFETRVAVHVGEFLTAGDSLSAQALQWPVHLLHDADAGGLALSEDAWVEIRRQVPLRGRLSAPRMRRDLPDDLRVFVVPPAGAGYLAWSLRRGGWKTLLAAAGALTAILVGIRYGPRAWRGGAGATSTAAAAPAVPSLRAVHGFEARPGTFTYAGDGGSVRVEFVDGGVRDRAARAIHATTAPGSFWGLVVQVGQDWSGWTGVRISMKAVAGRSVRLQIIEDASAEHWVTEVTPGPAWDTRDIPFARFVPRAEFNPGTRDGVLDLSRVRVLEIIQAAAPASDTLWVDELALYGAAAP